VKRSVTIAGHRTSVSLEPEFWAELAAIAKTERRSLADLIATVDGSRQGGLTRALRLLVLKRLKAQAQGAA
jgi:predicted DNA-binding ribbon-helix-helix protein